MMKRNNLKALFAAAMASVMVMSNALCVAAEEPGDVADPVAVLSNADVSDGNAGTATPTPAATATPAETPIPAATATPAAEKSKLAAPAELSWGRNYTACWKEVPEAHGYYDVELLRDGESAYRMSVQYSYTSETLSHGLSDKIDESGTYQFRVRAASDYDPETTEDSDWVSSPTVTYVRPDAQLKTTAGYWDETTPGLFHYTSVKEAGGYDFNVYYKQSEDDEPMSIGGRMITYGKRTESEDGCDLTTDLSRYIERNGAGLYCVAIRVCSNDIDTIRNSEWGEKSEFYDTTKTAADVNTALKDALNNSATASEALATVKDSVSKNTLKTAMQTDSETLKQMKELEDRYTKEKNISVQAPEVSAAAASYVDSGKITMVGAGLNAESGNVQLSVGIPEKPEYISDKNYKKTVQLAIELKNDDASIHELDVPITITMPIPQGLDTSRLAILHYHTNGSVESVTLKNNGDGTVTFTVTSFSTFVFAEKAETTEDASGDSGSDNTNNSGSTGSSDSTSSSGGGSVSYDWNDMTVSVDWADASSRLDTAIQVANDTNVNVLTGKDVKVSADILKKIAGKKVTLALQAGNGVALSVSGRNNKQIQSELNLTVTNKDTIPAQVKNAVMAGALNSKNILITENSPLQARVSLHVGFAAEYAGKYANLYYFDAKSGQMKLVGSYQINKDGQSMFALTHGGQYVVTVTNTASKAVVTDGYTVVPGDTMSRIAVKLGTTLKALKAANPQIADMNKIHPGQVINDR